MLIVVTEAGHPPIEHRTDAPEVTIGRSPTCDVVVARPFVSGRHLRILAGGVAHDLGSTNGTFLEGRFLDRPEVIAGRTLTIGGFEVSVRVLPDPHGEPAPAAVSRRADTAEDTVEVLPGATDLDTPSDPGLAGIQLDRLRTRVAALEAELEAARGREAELYAALGRLEAGRKD